MKQYKLLVPNNEIVGKNVSKYYQDKLDQGRVPEIWQMDPLNPIPTSPLMSVLVWMSLLHYNYQ